MSFASSLIPTHLTYKAAIILAVTRIVFYWVPRLRHIGRGLDYIIRYCSSDEYSTISPGTTTPQSDQMVTTMAHYSQLDDDDVTSYEEMVADGRLHRLENCKACAVCLNEFKGKDMVRELKNCCHVFHSECIDRWFYQNDQKTCPLCRTSLVLHLMSMPLTTSAANACKSEPSWAVERILYLFGDDLL